MRRFREKLAELLEGTRAAAQRDIPAGNLRDRAPVSAIPPLDLSGANQFTGILDLARGGTEADLSTTGPGAAQQASVGAPLTIATLGAALGGTGQSSYAIGDLLYASGTTALSKLAGVATGNALISGGVTTAPVWGKIGLATHVSGTLGIANGGTGQTAANAGFAALSPLTTRGDLITRDATVPTRLAIGAAGRYLRSDGTDPSWAQPLFSDLVYSGLTTGQVLRATGASAAAFGALDLANSSAVTGVLAAANGGTGVNNAGTITNASNTTITGGGTLALGGFTLTAPATGTAALRASSAAAGRVGVWSSATALENYAGLTWDNSGLVLATTGSAQIGFATGNYLELIKFSAAVFQLNFFTTTGNPALMDINPTPADGASASTFRFFRSVTTTGLVSFNVYKGDGSGTINGQFAGNTHSYVSANNSAFYVGKTSGLTGHGDLDVLGIIAGDAHIRLAEITAPAAPAANQGVLYLDDNGAGKTRLNVRFSSGAVQIIATQP